MCFGKTLYDRAMFPEQSAPASRMAAALCIEWLSPDALFWQEKQTTQYPSSLPWHVGSCQIAEVTSERMSTIVDNSASRRPNNSATIEEPVVPLALNVYGHRLAGLRWEERFALTCGLMSIDVSRDVAKSCEQEATSSPRCCAKRLMIVKITTVRRLQKSGHRDASSKTQVPHFRALNSMVWNSETSSNSFAKKWDVDHEAVQYMADHHH